ncbi:MAG: hypothetical protein CSB44_03615 [Gammaproteobacteria bacterium]|nr:MAG: hypothetical protein CSB44_03615 [Gammaproteobacteria bacterium]
MTVSEAGLPVNRLLFVAGYPGWIIKVAIELRNHPISGASPPGFGRMPRAVDLEHTLDALLP